MRDKFIRATSGWIPGIVLLLFAAALVYGRPPAEIGDGPARSVSLPARIELTIYASLDLPARSVRIEFPAVVAQGALR